MYRSQKLLASVFSALTLSIAVTAFADDFADKLHAKYPSTVGAKIEKAFPGFWSVVKDGEVVFIKDDLSVLINGEVVDLTTNVSLTSKLKADNLPKLDISKLPLNDAIKLASGKHKLYVFSDPDCPYCRRLESQLNQLKDVDLYIFPYPLTSLHPNSERISKNIWCDANKATAWNDYLNKAITPKEKDCDNPIARNIDLAAKLNITGTPAIIFEDGTLVPGALDAARITTMINQIGTKK